MDKLTPPQNWDQLNEQLWQRSWDADSKQSNPYVAFRGLPEDYGNLRTTVQRLGHPRPQLNDNELESRERRLIDNFRLYASQHTWFGPSDWDVLLLAQHYRLPTRLLDWTSSPYVALFFATEDPEKHDRDGVIWCVQRKETNSSLPAPFSKMLAEQQGYNLLYLETLRKSFERLETFDKESKDAPIWFEPPSISPRIVNQYAFFSVMPGVGTSLSDWLERHPQWYWGVTQPVLSKKYVNDYRYLTLTGVSCSLVSRALLSGWEHITVFRYSLQKGLVSCHHPDRHNAHNQALKCPARQRG